MVLGINPAWDPQIGGTQHRGIYILLLKELEEEMATHSGILAWRIPGTEEPGGPQSMGSQTVGHN